MAKPDLTKRYIAEQFKVLVRRGDYRSITVQAIAQACEINRKTFYYHFFGREDLATYVFRTDLANRLSEAMGESNLMSNANSEDDKYRMYPCFYRGVERERHIEFFREFSNYVKDECAFLRKMYGSSDWGYFTSYLFQVYRPLFEGNLRAMLSQRNAVISDDELAYLASYYTNASVLWVINRHVAMSDHYSDDVKRNLGSLIIDSMEGALDRRCLRSAK